jgi:hypothetical protein
MITHLTRRWIIHCVRDLAPAGSNHFALRGGNHRFGQPIRAPITAGQTSRENPVLAENLVRPGLCGPSWLKRPIGNRDPIHLGPGVR